MFKKIKHPLILKKETSALLIVDIQEKILPVMHSPDAVAENTIKLIKGFKVMEVPIFYTEQYPKGLGCTVPEIASLLDFPAIQKMSFSCCDETSIMEQLKSKKIFQVVVCGIESHVCVQQTVLDLMANDFQVDVAADAVSSRRESDYRTALERMAKAGAEITSAESILFELLRVSGTDQFRAISKIVK